MKRRLIRTLMLCGLYLAVVLGSGLFHNHDASDPLHGRDTCQVCVWQNTTVTDEPLAPILPVFSFGISLELLTSSSQIQKPLVTLSLDRGPPTASI